MPEDGIVHGCELSYVHGGSYTAENPNVFGFEGVDMPLGNETSNLELSRTRRRTWLSFAGHLNPNRLGNLGGRTAEISYWYVCV